jgi:diguanylate cyclase (GGDEF)-like protein
VRVYSRRFAIAGFLLGLGAPVGLVVLRLAISRGTGIASTLSRELFGDALLYLYLTLTTSSVMAVFGWVLGREEDVLAQVSLTDALTGLWNRRHFDTRLQEEHRRAERYGQTMSVLILDLDRFKAVNDRFGHLQGDQVLRRIAGLVKDEFRSIDVVCRYGGEEIAVIAPNTGLDEAAALAERVRGRIASAEMPGLGSDRITVSIGLAAWQPGLTADEVTLRADEALYAAKSAGRNRVRSVASDPDVVEAERFHLH